MEKVFQRKKKLLKLTHTIRVSLAVSSQITPSQIEDEKETIAEALLAHLPKCVSENLDVTVLDIDVKVSEL